MGCWHVKINALPASYGTVVKTGLIDPHTHTAFLSWKDLTYLAEAGYEAVVTLAYTPYVPSHPASLEDHFTHLEAEASRLKAVGLRAVIGVGLHPRCIKPGHASAQLEVVRRWLPKAHVLGEVGIENPTSNLEAEALRTQLMMAKEAGLTAVIHTPRNRKREALKAIINAVRESGIKPENVVIDHLTPEPALLDEVIKLGAWAGVTIQPGKASVQDLEYLIEAVPEALEHTLINSDAGRDPSNPLAAAEAYEALVRKGYVTEAYRLASINPKEAVKALSE